jgi:hypothetical protein
MTFRKPESRRARRVILGLAALATILLVVVVIAATGSSSTSTNTNTATSSPAAASASAGTSASRTAIVKCLQEHGVTIPPHAPGSGTPTTHSGPPPAGSVRSGSGNSTRQAAFKACGVTGQHSKTP